MFKSKITVRFFSVIIPNDPYAFIGERLDLTCTIYNSSSNQPVQMYFVTSVNDSGKWKDKRLNQTTQLNNTTIQLISPVLTFTDAQNHYVTRSYRCMVQQEENECTKKRNKTISNQRVRIDYFPQNPENFSCEVDNWEKMNCRWDMVSYFHKKDIHITHFWKADKNCEGSLLNYTVTEPTTTFTIPDFKMEPDYCFFFEIANVVRDVKRTTTVFHISPFNIVKPAPVDFISFPNISDTCVNVVWNHSKQFIEQVFRVRFISECSTEQQFHLVERDVTFCGLNPYTNYTFFVDSKPKNLNGSSPLETVGFISDSRSNTVTTKTTVPAANPKLLSYRDLFCSKSPCRHVLLYWEPLSPCDLHDSPSGQQYEIITRERGSVETRNYTVNDSDAISQPLMLPDEEKVYEVKLRVITGNGKKREDFSHLVIWPRKQSPIAPSMVVEYDTVKNGTDFYITLSLTEAQLQTSQILYWCRVSQEGGCQKQMSHMGINGSSTKISIRDYRMDFNIIFGVESRQRLLKEITQSGIQMVNCIYPKDQKPLIPPKNFHISKEIAEREGELSLQWDPYDCNNREPESGYVLNYTLYYCQVTDESSCNVSNTKASLGAISIAGYIYSYTIRNLKPGSWYKVWLTARTSAGEGPPTDVINKDIFIEEFPLWGKIYIIVGLVIFFVAILSCFIKIYRYIKGRMDTFSKIEVPDTRFQFKNTDDYVQIQTPNIPQMNGHVIVNDQSAETIPDMDESEELNSIIPLIEMLDDKFHMAKNSAITDLMMDLRLLDMPFFGKDHKNYGHCISSNDMASACGDTGSGTATKDHKEIKPAVLLSEHSYQNANLLPVDYCRAVGNVDYDLNIETNPTLYEDMLDNKFLMMQGQAVHSQSINSLLNDVSELQRTNIILQDDCKGNTCESDEDIDSVCENDSLYLSTQNVTIEKHIEPDWMKSKHDFESDELVPSGDDDAASEDSLSLWDDICRSFDKTEKTNGYVCASKINDDTEGPFHSFNHWKYTEYSNVDKDFVGSDDEHVKHEADTARSVSGHVRSDKYSMRSENDHVRSDVYSMRSENDHVRSDIYSMRSESDHVRSDVDEISHDNFVLCGYVNSSTGDGVKTIHTHKVCGNRIPKFQRRDSFKSFTNHDTSSHDNPRVQDHDPDLIHSFMNIVQSGIPENQKMSGKLCRTKCESKLIYEETIKVPANKKSQMHVFPHDV
ncbi:hypothetical protein ACJMK2_042276 [Sinanodonta woodiana]|uniref:Fibronectin type-III domain-containing protein n=1 Tax=Sinanodonta woodiana TaxID=1069815 RepID=A0ABD3W6V6_SINWO